MKRYQGYISDLDGTLYRGEEVIPGAPEAIAELRRRGCGVVFISNKPLERRRAYAEKLTRLGIPTVSDEVINSSLVLARYLANSEHGMAGATVFAIGEPPLLEELATAGLRLSDVPEEIEVVIASFDRTFDYHKLNIGFQALRRGARFLATNADPTCPVEGGEIPDAGAVIGALEGCSGRKVELVVGKPSPLIMEMALERLGLPAEACLMVGDRLETDIVMGHRAGMSTALVLSGVTRREDLSRSSIRPDYVLESIADLPRLIS
ncbi:MAG TPA: HAD-IIA family hydrolase [Anaerolineae bacterium]|nr:HAD-IIA family hydrolase [Anaerolineae bacterium]